MEHVETIWCEERFPVCVPMDGLEFSVPIVSISELNEELSQTFFFSFENRDDRHSTGEQHTQQSDVHRYRKTVSQYHQ